MIFNNFRQKTKLFLLILTICFGSLVISGQKKKIVSDSADVPPPVKKQTAVGKKAEPINFTIVEIDENSKIKIYSVSEAEEYTSQANPSNLAKAVSINLNQKIPVSLLGSGEIIIKPDMSLKYEELVKISKTIRSQTKQKIKVKLGEYFYAWIPEAKTKTAPRPNPLFLLVNIDTNGKILLNTEEEGTTKDFSTLQNHLVKIFKDREDSGVFRIGSNEVEKTIFIKLPLSFGLITVAAIANAVKETGANPIFLQID
jgi:biopolymer transport protein ExbD